VWLMLLRARPMLLTSGLMSTETPDDVPCISFSGRRKWRWAAASYVGCVGACTKMLDEADQGVDMRRHVELSSYNAN
jgi:hypothetical protein